MIRNFKIVKVDHKYCDYLRQYDNRVSYNAGTKELRQFIGVLFTVEGCEYFEKSRKTVDTGMIIVYDHLVIQYRQTKFLGEWLLPAEGVTLSGA